jgi:sugar lactone lactonase YvrE
MSEADKPKPRPRKTGASAGRKSPAAKKKSSSGQRKGAPKQAPKPAPKRKTTPTPPAVAAAAAAAVEREQAAAAEAPAQEAAAQPRRGLYLTPRQTFGLLAIGLIVALLVLLWFLLTALRPTGGLVTKGGTAVEGIQPVLTIQGPGRGAQPTFQRPLGVAYGPDGRIYVRDTGNNRVCVFERDGSFVKEWGGFGVAKPAPGGVYSWKPGSLNFPDGIAVDEQSNVYVADFRNDCIEVFDRDGKFLRRFPDPTKPTGRGSSGQDGKGIAVTSVAVAAGKVYATDTYQVFVFTTSGRLLQQFGKPGRGAGDLDHPNGIAVAPDGTIYVSDSNHARVVAFKPDGTPKWTAGRIPTSINDTSPAAFELPRGLAVMPDTNVIVVDVFGFDLVRLSATGQVVAKYGERGVEPGQFNFPNAVSVLGSTLAVADKENNRIQVLRLVKK